MRKPSEKDVREDSALARTVASLLKASEDLPPMPEVARRVLAMTEADDASPADLQQVILLDPALSARILRVANAALFGQSHRVGTISHAVIILGRSAVRNLAVHVRQNFAIYALYFIEKENPTDSTHGYTPVSFNSLPGRRRPLSVKTRTSDC